MNNKPIIGIVAKHYKCESGHNCTYGKPGIFIGEQTIDAVRHNGGTHIGIMPPDDGVHLMQDDGTHDSTYKLDKDAENSICEQMSICDGIIFQGGDTKDLYEFYMARYAYNKNIPTLGFCAGHQLLGQTFGSKLNKLLNADSHFAPDRDYVHNVNILPRTKLHRLVGKNQIRVNSKHRYGLITIPKGFRCAAVDGLGQCEAIEAIDKTFFIGTQWHPELLTSDEAKTKS